MKFVTAILIVALVAAIAFFFVSRAGETLELAGPEPALPAVASGGPRELSAQAEESARASAPEFRPSPGPTDGEEVPAEEDPVEARKTILFHVLERATEAELSSVDLLVRRGDDSGCVMLPTQRLAPDALARGVESPVAVVSEARAATYWAVAEGYAWGYLEVQDPERRSEYEIKLGPACGLEVTVENHDPAWNAKLFVQRSPGSRPGTRAVIDIPEDGVVRLERLEGGEYTIAGIQGEWSNPVTLGRATTKLSPGRMSRISLVLDEPPSDADRVALSGELVLTEGIPLRQVVVTIRPAGHALSDKQPRQRLLGHEMTPSPEDDERLVWRGAPVLPGAYVAVVEPFGIRQEFTVGERGAFVSLALPETYEVRVVVGFEGPAAELPSLTGTFWAEGMSYKQTVSPADYSNVYLFRVPEGTLRLSVKNLEWVDPATSYDVPAGGGEILLTLRRPCKVEISLYDGETSHAVNRGWSRMVRARSSSDSIVESPRVLDEGGETVLLSFQSVGSLELHFAVVPGFRLIPPAAVELAPGETLRVRIQLER